MKKITVCIADMDVGYRASLRKALESSGSVEVVADAGDGLAALEAVETLSDRLTALTLRGDFPCEASGLEWGEVGFMRGCGAFARQGVLTVYCELAETASDEEESV